MFTILNDKNVSTYLIADFMSQVKWKESTRFFNIKFRCIDDALSLNKVDDFVDYIYAIELEIKHFKDTAESTSCLALHLDIDWG
jgi:hypothetical protein